MAMFSTFASVLPFIQLHGYFIMFLAMILEGPMITTVASFAASLGFFDITVVFILSVLGDIIGDLAYFYLGRVGKMVFLRKHEHFFGIKEKTIKKISNHLKNNIGKTILAIKLTPFISLPGIVIIGDSHIKFKKFIAYCLAIIIPKSLLFVAIGYYFGFAFDSISRYLRLGEWTIGIVVILILIAPFIFKKILVRIGRFIDRF